MTPPTRIEPLPDPLQAAPSFSAVPQLWAEVAGRITQWLREQQLQARDAIVLLPFAALLPPLRAAFAQAGGWQVRVETTLTLAGSLGPPAPQRPGCCCGDPVLDRLTASALLRGQREMAELAQRDALLFEHLVASVVDAAQAFMEGAAATEPAAREAFWATARTGIAQTTGGLAAAALEARLLSIALEWAAQSCSLQPPASDALYGLVPSAWVVVRLGGPDPLADAVARSGRVPSRWLDLDPALALSLRPGSGSGTRGAEPEALEAADELAPAWSARALASTRWLCDDFESEAQAAAACVIEAVNAGRVPVALVAVDRALVRRVRALLDRQELPLLDETGWLLATTPAAAQLMALLRAAQALQQDGVDASTPARACSGASRDALLDWLKGRHLARTSASDPAAAPAGAASRRAVEDGQALDALEALWRGRRSVSGRAGGLRCWRQAVAQLLPLAEAPRQSLLQWLALLRQVLQSDGSLQRMQDDGAGQQVLQALRVAGPASPAWDQAAQSMLLNLAGFVAWTAATLEQSPYLPLPDEHALVVLTPLSRAFGRPFGQVVVPGADHKQLGSPQTQASLIGPQLARLLGLPDDRHKHLQQRLSLVHLLRADAVTFTRRLRDLGEPLSESPDLVWLTQTSGADLALASDAPGPAWQLWQPPLCQVSPQPVMPPQPSAAQDLPQRLSASQLDAYRQCPYRFYARAVLRLDEPEELDAGLDKRDYGNWLHAVLHRFHSQRDYRQPAAPQLQQAARLTTQEQALSEAELLPWLASFEHFSPAYLAWLQQRESEGWFWADGETDHEAAVDALPHTRLRGRLDRIDHGPAGQQQVIDYKTGDAEALARKVKQPLEDTQLAFYAAVLNQGAATEPGELLACYLALDDKKAPRVIEHDNVAHTAAVMLQGLGGEWQRLRDGHPLLALGEGAVCDTCEARGLCRRDHWGPAAA